MKRWRVFVNGTNFRLAFQEEGKEMRVQRMGFYTTVFLTARTAKQAEFKAMDILRRDKSLRTSVRNTRADPPRMFADEIQEIASFRGCKRPRTGFALYGERGPKRKHRHSPQGEDGVGYAQRAAPADAGRVPLGVSGVSGPAWLRSALAGIECVEHVRGRE